MQRLVTGYRVGVDWLGVENRLADVAQRLIDSVRERMHYWRLMIASDYNTRPAVRSQIIRNRLVKPRCSLGPSYRKPNSSRQSLRKILDVTRLYRQPMVRLHPC